MVGIYDEDLLYTGYGSKGRSVQGPLVMPRQTGVMTPGLPIPQNPESAWYKFWNPQQTQPPVKGMSGRSGVAFIPPTDQNVGATQPNLPPSQVNTNIKNGSQIPANLPIANTNLPQWLDINNTEIGALPIIRAMGTPTNARAGYIKGLIENARNLPGAPIPSTKEEGIRTDLTGQGFVPITNLPGGKNKLTGTSNLGPAENILVRERLGKPEDYTAAVQAQQAGTTYGRRLGLPQSVGALPYEPNEATRMGMEKGGAITEYAIPGKGTATFLGERRGGGAFSVVGGRTPEEQQAINERVASINSQTAAMRDLRNAQRLEQGLPTVEQEQQANSMNAMLERLAPAPNLSALDDAQAQLMQELKDASQLKGFGSRRIRDDRMKVAQTGLAQIAATREGALRDHATQRNAALEMMKNQQDLAAKQAETERAARQWAAEQGLEWNKLDVQTQRNIADAYDQAVARDIAQKNLALNEARLARGTPGNVTPNDIKQYYNPALPGKPEELNIPKLLDVEGIGVAPETGFIVGKPYVNPKTGKIYRFTNENGDREEIGLREAIIMNRELQRNR